MSDYEITVNIQDGEGNRKSDVFLQRSDKSLDDFSFEAVKRIRETIKKCGV